MNYRLRMDIRIESLDERGYPVSNGGLVIGQNIDFEAESFLEIAHVLGQFHELAESIKSDERAAG